MAATTANRPHPIRSAIIMMFNPGEIIKNNIAQIKWPFSLMISMGAFVLFFLQTGLDLMRTGQKQLPFVLMLVLAGALFGFVGVGFLAALSWAVAGIFKGEKTFSWVLTAFGLSFCSSLVYGLFGLVTALVLNWNTSIVFGVTGVLWATGPIISTIREMLRGKTAMSIVMAILCCSLLLCGWSLLGNM